MLGVFGQVPVTDLLIGTTALKIFPSQAFGARYMVSFLAFSGSLPQIAIVQAKCGFGMLFYILISCAILILFWCRALLSAPNSANCQPAEQNTYIIAQSGRR